MGTIQSATNNFKWQDKFQIIDNNSLDKTLSLMERDSQDQFIGKQISCYNQAQIKQFQRILDKKMAKNSPYLVNINQIGCKEGDRYCSQQKIFYVLYKKPYETLKQESINRKFKYETFSQQQIELILEAVVKGLLFLQQIGQPHRNISSSSIYLREDRSILLGDPWLYSTDSNQSINLNINGYTYPSPQKILYQNDMIESYNLYLSDYYSLGVVLLQLLYLEHMDIIYDKGYRRILENKLIEKIENIRINSLKTKIKILLSHEPIKRNNICKYYLGGEPPNIKFIKNQRQKFKKHYMKSNMEVSNVKQWQEKNHKTQKDDVSIINKIADIKDNYHANQFKIRNSVPYTIGVNNPTSKENLKYETNNNLVFPINFNKNPVIYENFTQKSTLNNHLQNHLNKRENQIKFKIEPKINYQLANQQMKYESSNNNQFIKHHSMRNPSLTNKTMAYQFSSPSFSYKHEQKLKQNELPKSLQGKSIVQSFNDINITSSVNNSLSENEKLKQNNQNKIVEDKLINQNKSNPLTKNKIEELNNLIKQVQSINISEDKSQMSEVIGYGFREKNSASYDVNSKIENLDKNRASLPQKNQKDSFQSLQSDHIITKVMSNSSDNSILEIINQETRKSEKKQQTPPKKAMRQRYGSTIKQVSEQSPSIESPNGSFEEKTIDYDMGTRYIGQFKNGKRNGRGVFYYQDGSYYEGYWKDNKMHGRGSLFYSSGKLAYEGGWYLDDFHGQGRIYNENPSHIDGEHDYKNLSNLDNYWELYDGQFVADKRNGKGKLKLSNGELFIGFFAEDRISGQGRYYRLNGEIIHGMWMNNILIEEYYR